MPEDSFFTKEYADMHKLPEQVIRQQRALTVPDVSVDKDTQTGIIHGYHTTLRDCSCMDFRQRGLPCKHMYRLAMELGIIPKLMRPKLFPIPYDDFKAYKAVFGRNPYLAYKDILIYNELEVPARQVDIIAQHPEYTKGEVLGALDRLSRNHLILKSKDGRYVCWAPNPENYLTAEVPDVGADLDDTARNDAFQTAYQPLEEPKKKSFWKKFWLIVIFIAFLPWSICVWLLYKGYKHYKNSQ
ncbi:SWIM zinc finger family protein [Mitsuokella sp.]|uniref:SWIM zinc finger family protein n=1 Tax=Mitsuokella sp. TaxID=2049034 RepID=UPI003D7D2993